MNLGAIDIGSNAARVLIMEVFEGRNGLEFNKLKLLRYPIRLGFDAFLKGEIGQERTEKMVKMCTIFKLLMELYDVKAYKAYATSAMRSAKNGLEIVERVRKESGVDIEIIEGLREASILYQTHFESKMNPTRNYIYVDVGGGSTEITLFRNKQLIESKSFKVGTIRMLYELNQKSDLKKIKHWVEERTEGQLYYGIGSGGNINSLFGLSGKRKHEPIKTGYITQSLKEFKQHTVKELMNIYSFKSDRADVIVPALKIYKTVFKAANVQEVFVPKIGLADGIIRLIAQDL